MLARGAYIDLGNDVQLRRRGAGAMHRGAGAGSQARGWGGWRSRHLELVSAILATAGRPTIHGRRPRRWEDRRRIGNSKAPFLACRNGCSFISRWPAWRRTLSASAIEIVSGVE
jgi:hypothetical protein